MGRTQSRTQSRTQDNSRRAHQAANRAKEPQDDKRRLTRIEAAARLAILLSRNEHGRHFTVIQNTFNAVAILSAAAAVRRAVETGKPADKPYARAEAVAKWYTGVKVLRREDLQDGYVLGLQFPEWPKSLPITFSVW